MSESMKIENLKNYDIPPYIVDIWKKHYSHYLLPLQEEAVKKYGVLGCGKGIDGIATLSLKARNDKENLPRRFTPRNDRKGTSRNHPHPALSPQGIVINSNKNLLVIAPTASGKSFIGEMAAIAKAIYLQKTIYLVPLREPTFKKYRTFKKLYGHCGMKIAISTRDRSEMDHLIISGDYDVAVMAYEKYNYFCLKCPQFLKIVSLVIIDDMQRLNCPKWGPLLKSMIYRINSHHIRLIALSSFFENRKYLLKWLPARVLLSKHRPMVLRKGIVRNGFFHYVTSKFKKETFFKPENVHENSFEDYLAETVKYLVKQGESVLIFFATCAETRKWAQYLAIKLETPVPEYNFGTLTDMEETLSRDILEVTLKKGISFYNQNLSWEERNFIETHLKNGNINIVCATSIMANDINLQCNNVIIAMDKIYNNEGNYPPDYQTSLTFSAIENMSGRAGILAMHKMKKDGFSFDSNCCGNFGRVIFLAPCPFLQTVYSNLYFKYLKDNTSRRVDNHALINMHHDLPTYLLKLVTHVKLNIKSIKNYIKKEGLFDANKLNMPDKTHQISVSSHYDLNHLNNDKLIDRYLNRLMDKKLIKTNKSGYFIPSRSGILIAAKRIKINTFLFFKDWLHQGKIEDISILEILFLLALSPDGQDLSIPISQHMDSQFKKEFGRCDDKKRYWNKLLHLVFAFGDEDKMLFRDQFIKKHKDEEQPSLKDCMTYKKTLLLYDWISGKKSVKAMEQEYALYRGCICKLGESFSWLTDSLAAIAEMDGREAKYHKYFHQIRILSKQLVAGIPAKGIHLALLYIPGLNRYHIIRLVEAGYKDIDALRDAGQDEWGKLLPKSLVNNIQKKINEENHHRKALNEKWKDRDKSSKIVRKIAVGCGAVAKSGYGFNGASENSCIKERPPAIEVSEKSAQPVLQISKYRPDRIIFTGKEVKVTATEFAFIYLLAKNAGNVMRYDKIINELWGEDVNAIYTRVTYHFSNIRKVILKEIGKSRVNIEKIRNILMIVPRRGIMLNLTNDEIKMDEKCILTSV